MPIWLRKFTFSELQSFYDKKNKPPDNLNTKQLIDKDGNVNVPEFAKTSAATIIGSFQKPVEIRRT